MDQQARARAPSTYRLCKFNPNTKEPMCVQLSTRAPNTLSGNCKACLCAWRRCEACILQTEEGPPEPVEGPGRKLCTFHSEKGRENRRPNDRAVAVANASQPGWSQGFSAKITLQPSAPVTEQLRKRLTRHDVSVRRALAQVHKEEVAEPERSDLTAQFREKKVRDDFAPSGNGHADELLPTRADFVPRATPKARPQAPKPQQAPQPQPVLSKPAADKQELERLWTQLVDSGALEGEPGSLDELMRG